MQPLTPLRTLTPSLSHPPLERTVCRQADDPDAILPAPLPVDRAASVQAPVAAAEPSAKKKGFAGLFAPLRRKSPSSAAAQIRAKFSALRHKLNVAITQAPAAQPEPPKGDAPLESPRAWGDRHEMFRYM